MIKLALTCAFLTCGLSASWAAAVSCDMTAAEKKLSGAAKTSFLKKCEKDAMTTCEKASADKKLAGAAKASFEKKCAADAVGKKS